MAKAKSQPKDKQTTKPFKCEYCNGAYAREETLLTHMCAKKQRLINKDQRVNRIAYGAYRKFFQIQFRYRAIPTYYEFAMSRHYNAFLAYGTFIIEHNVPYSNNYLDFVMHHKMGIKKWTSLETLREYIQHIIKTLPLEDAVEYGIALAQEWAEYNNEHWTDFFRKIHPNIAIQYIKSGKLHPWFIYTSPSGTSMFDRMSDEQIEIVAEVIDYKYWKARMLMKKAEFAWTKQTLQEAGL